MRGDIRLSSGRSRLGGIAAAALILVLGANANAAPINYVFSSGTADVTVTAGAEILVDTTTLDFGGATATFDPATGILSDFDWSLSTAPIQTLVFGLGAATLSEYGGFESIDINSANLTPNVAPAYSPGIPFPAGPGAWFVSVSNVLVTGTYTGYPAVGAPVGPVAVPSFNNGSLTGQITTAGLFTFGPGVTIGQLPGSLFGETDDLQINATITWQGTPAPVPEPGSLTLMGLLSIAFIARRSWLRA